MSNKHEEDEWEEVGSFGMSWEPKASGSAKDKNYKAKEPSEDSWMTGYYKSTKEDVGINKSQVHTFKLVKVGNPDDLSGEESSDVSVWGSGVLDKKIAEGVAPGQLVRVKWLGIKENKKPGGKPYHDFEVKVNTKAEPLGSAVVPPDLKDAAATSAANVASGPVSAAAALDDDDDSDLPF